MILDSCTQSCGWTAAFVGCLAMGSFAVPMKGRAATSVDVDPLVFQTYKTAMCLATCWMVLLLGEEFTFTPIGICSGFLWVTGGTGGIYGVRNAGLAISVGIWSGLTVLISFIWGLFIFDEPVKSLEKTFFGAILMISGLIGMSYFSSPSSRQRLSVNNDEVESLAFADDLSQNLLASPDEESRVEACVTSSTIQEGTERDDGFENLDNQTDVDTTDTGQTISILGFNISRRHLGLLGAATDGIMGGSSLVPMHYSEYKGLSYVISFAIGSSLVTVLFWAIRLAVQTKREGSFTSACQKLPLFHWRKMLLPGIISGVLYSIGNVGSILSVTYLGEGIGMSMVQSCMIVSGVWGIFWFQEIQNLVSIVCWFVSAGITVWSILFLAHEETGIPVVPTPQHTSFSLSS